MRHHPENIGVAVLVEDFAGAVAGFRGIAVIDTGHFSPWFFVGIIFIGRIAKPYPAADAEATRLSQNAAALLFELGTVDIRRVGTQTKRILVAGCSE
jgi:hypothetical protein